MKRKLIALSIAAAFAIPLAVQAESNKQSSSSGGSAAQGSSAAQGASKTGNKGADAMFNSLDKNKDGNLSKDEVKGTPHDKDFSKLDKNNDNKLTPQEHASAAEHQKDKAASGSTSSGSSGSSSSGSSSGSAKKY